MADKNKIINQFSNNDKFSPELVFLIDFMADELASELPVLVMDVDYFILAILNSRSSYAYNLFKNFFDDEILTTIHDSYWQYISSKTMTAVKPGRKIQITPDLEKLCKLAETEMGKLENEKITSAHMILALLANDIGDNRFRKILEKQKLDYKRFKMLLIEDSISNMEIDLDGDIKFDTTPEDMFPGAKKTSGMNNGYKVMQVNGGSFGEEKNYVNTIKQYCNNINELFEKGQKEPLIGREKEIEELIISLGRKRKNNVILIGDEGIGKTAIAEHLAEKIVNDDVPDYLSGKKVLSLNMTALMAGTTLRGQFEERVQKVLDTIEKEKNILLIDNIGDVLATKHEDYGIAPMLAQKMEQGRLQVMGTCDYKSYKKTFEKKMSLARLFQNIEITKPNKEESILILKGLKEHYEKFHKVKYEEKALELCVDLAEKYISEKNLPDSAIDVMDDAGIHKRMGNENQELKKIKDKIKTKQKYLASLKRKKNAEKSYEEIDSVILELNDLKKQYNSKAEEIAKEIQNNPAVITEEDIKHIVSIKTRIPISQLSSDDKQNLAELNKIIKQYVIGQDDAVDTICRAIKRNRLGLKGNGCLFSGMLLGSTGVGKTFLAKMIAKMMFGDENMMIRFDMSEYSDKTSVNKLIGSNPGYVGYEEGGLLTEKVKHNKYCVLLMDEIEKADPEVYNLFLQVLDDGYLTDNYGSKIDFHNVIILFTTNVGAKAAIDFGRGIGFNVNVNENKKQITQKELENEFPPEFLNRLDEIIYFNHLEEKDLKEIIYLELNDLKKRIEGLGYGFDYYSLVTGYILDKIKDESEYGARPIKRVIKREIENLIADDILENDRQKGYVFKIDVDDNDNLILL